MGRKPTDPNSRYNTDPEFRERMKTRQKERYAEDPEKFKQRYREWSRTEAGKEKRREISKRYYENHKARIGDKTRGYYSTYYQEHREEILEKARIRREAKKKLREEEKRNAQSGDNTDQA